MPATRAPEQNHAELRPSWSPQEWWNQATSLIHDSLHRHLVHDGSGHSCKGVVPRSCDESGAGWQASFPAPSMDRAGMNRNGSDVARRPYVLVAPGTVR